MGKLFGTDGIRCKANEFPLRPEDVLKFAQALACLIKEKDYYPNKNFHTAMIAKDTRLSGYMIEYALASAFNSLGIHVILVGPVPTPALGFLVQSMRADIGLMISASHNPYYDNGIKVFNKEGRKLSDEDESMTENFFFNRDFSQDLVKDSEIGRTKRIDDVAGRYIVHVKRTFPYHLTLDGLKIVLDTANGAAYSIAPKIFEELGGQVIPLGNKPNGTNINLNSGAIHPKEACKEVIRSKADFGICLDGDADRVVFIDKSGQVVSGDVLLGLCAIYLKKKNLLNKDTLVVNQASNLGLDISLAAQGIKVLRTPVGDRHIAKKMLDDDLSLGGENSGHIIFKEYTKTGDACIAALSVLSFLVESGSSFEQLSQHITLLPQVSKNISFDSDKSFEDLDSSYKDVLNSIEGDLEKAGGRALVRPSGTEKKIRVLLEGNLSYEKLDSMACQLEGVICNQLG